MKCLQLETIIFYIQKKHQPVNKLIPLPCYSNSIVPGGLEVISYITLFTPRTSLMILFIVSLQKNYILNKSEWVPVSINVSTRISSSFI